MDERFIIIAIIAGISGLVALFCLIKAGYTKEVREVLLYFVIQAEQMFGGKTGKIKRAAVLSWVLEQLPDIVRVFISAEQLGYMIDEAVEFMKRYLATNAVAAELVSKEDAQ